MTWRLARSLETFREQVDNRWPHRSKAADGTIGDAAHQTRTSDHNPNAHDVVTAIDVTHDPAHGADMTELAAGIRAARDPRTAYVIWNGRIFDGPHKSGTGGGGVEPWTWRGYDGADPHTGHLHMSVAGDPELYDDDSLWGVRPRSNATGTTLRRGDHGPAVEALQKRLIAAGYKLGTVDGQFGEKVERAVNRLKHAHGWPEDGVAGRRVWRAL